MCTLQNSCQNPMLQCGLWEIIRIRRGHEDEVFTRGISALIRVGRELASLSAPCHVKIREGSYHNLEEFNHASTLISDFRPGRNKFLWFTGHPVYDTLLYSSPNGLRHAIKLLQILLSYLFITICKALTHYLYVGDLLRVHEALWVI